MQTTVGGNAYRPRIVALVYVASIIIIAWGTFISKTSYADPAFVRDFAPVELGLALLLGVLSVTLFRPAQLGLMRPRLQQPRLIRPLLVMGAVAALGWIAARLMPPATARVDSALALGTLGSTLLVGFTEEWMYRGLLFAFFSRRLGMKRGALFSICLFAGFHLINIAAGVAVWAGLLQVVITFILGSVFLVGAVGTRSLWPSMLVHGVYDFCVFDLRQMTEAGGLAWPALIVALAAIGTGIYSLSLVLELEGREPYAAIPPNAS